MSHWLARDCHVPFDIAEKEVPPRQPFREVAPSISVPARGGHLVAPPARATHTGGMNFLSSEYNKASMDVLEVGSRVVTGANYRSKFSNASYTGFDFYDGPNVDVSGDAHRLSEYLGEKRFDLIFSLAVFEHLYAPWLVAEEIAKLLKVGGRAYVETHFSFSAHERPWNFFQFSDVGLRALFNRALGFAVEDVGMSNPIVGAFSDDADEYLRRKPVVELYCHSAILVRKERDVPDFDWRRAAVDDIVDGDRYPAPKPT